MKPVMKCNCSLRLFNTEFNLNVGQLISQAGSNGNKFPINIEAATEETKKKKKKIQMLNFCNKKDAQTDRSLDLFIFDRICSH